VIRELPSLAVIIGRLTEAQLAALARRDRQPESGSASGGSSALRRWPRRFRSAWAPSSSERVSAGSRPRPGSPEKAGLGGVWSTEGWANVSSRVQISEPNYRMIEENVTTPFTPQEELLAQMETLAARDGFEENIRYGATVISVRTVDAAGDETLEDDATVGVRVTYTDAAGQTRTLLASEHVLLCTGGLQTPNTDSLPSAGPFAGDVISGVNSEVDEISLGGKSGASTEKLNACVFCGHISDPNTHTIVCQDRAGMINGGKLNRRGRGLVVCSLRAGDGCVRCGERPVRKRLFCVPFYAKTRTFAKTGSGQT
jgi:hypothetical protein